jgi:hypothetical protein
LSHPGTGRRFLLAFAASCIVTVLWALPLVLHLDSRFLGAPSDATSTVRDYWYAEHVGKTPFSVEHDSLIAAPEGVDLSPGIQVANAVQPAFIWALKGLTGLVAAWNIFVLLGIALTGACTWLLLDSLGVGLIPAAFGAYAFMFSGYLVEKAYVGHGGLVQAWIFPLLLLALLRGRGKGLKHAIAAGLLVALAFYIHSYYGFFAFFLMVLFYCFEVVWDTDHPWRPAARRLALATGVVLAGLLPAVIAMHVLHSAPGGGAHSIDALQQFGARIPAYVAPVQWSPLGHHIPQSLQDRLEESGEPSLFFGFSTLVLAVLYVVRRRRPGASLRLDGFEATFAAALTVCAFVMSLPRLFHIGPVAIPAPSWFIGHFTTTWRVYARFGVLVGLGLVILAALSLAAIERSAGRRIAAVLLVVLVVELTPSLPATTWAATNVPASDRWLAAHPGGIAAIYPLAGDQPAASKLAGREYYFQRFHAHPLYSAIVPDMDRVALGLRVVSQYFTNPETAGILAAEHVRYVVLRDDVYREVHQKTPTLSGDDFRLVARVPNAQIYEVTAKPIDLKAYVAANGAKLAAAASQPPPIDHFGSGFFDPETYKYATPWRWMGKEGKITIEPVAGVEHLQFETLAFSNAQPHVLKLYGPGHTLLGQATVPTGMTPITFGPFKATGGKSITYTLETSPDPQPLSAADPRVTSVYLNEPVFRPVLVPAR